MHCSGVGDNGGREEKADCAVQADRDQIAGTDRFCMKKHNCRVQSADLRDGAATMELHRVLVVFHSSIKNSGEYMLLFAGLFVRMY